MAGYEGGDQKERVCVPSVEHMIRSRAKCHHIWPVHHYEVIGQILVCRIDAHVTNARLKSSAPTTTIQRVEEVTSVAACINGSSLDLPIGREHSQPVAGAISGAGEASCFTPGVVYSMAPVQRPATRTQWTAEYDTLRREDLFRNPPTDHTAYPSLQAAVLPHIDSFNVLIEKNGLLDQGIRDIGTKIFLDGDPTDDVRNSLSLRIKEVFLERPHIPPTNKFSTKNREVYPAECRERHVTYRGKFRAKLEYRVNGNDWTETVRDLGQLPIMLKVDVDDGHRPVLLLTIPVQSVPP